MANFINKYATQNAYEGDSTKQYPNVSYISGTDSVIFKEEADVEIFSGLTVYYNITDTTNEVTIWSGGGGSSDSNSDSDCGGGGDTPTPATMNVDGTDEVVQSTWRFSTTGEHVIKYTFNSNIMDVKFNSILLITKIEIGSGIIAIDGGIFNDCRNLSNVTISNNLTTIGQYAFYGCRGLTSIVIPSGVYLIGDRSFEGCRSLTSVTIPSGVTQIGSSAFYGCSALTSITVLPATPPSLGSIAFDNTSDAPIYVPNVSTYESASGWSTYSSRLQAIQ